jgi:hypothetical protein
MKLFGLIMALSVLHSGAIYSFSSTDSGMKGVPDDEILKVEIEAITDAEALKRFPWYSKLIDSRPNRHLIAFSVRNVTNQEQGFRIMSCSYFQHWAVDNKKAFVAPELVICGGNAAILMTLRPGESYSSLLPIALDGVAAGEVIEFRMSFTPYRKERIKGRFARLGPYWSNVLTIKAVDRKP